MFDLRLDKTGTIEDQSEGHLDAARSFAKNTKQSVRLLACLSRLRRIATNNKTTVKIRRDSCPYSFIFDIPGVFWGGLIYHGSHDGYGDGSGPTFAVCLNATNGWSIHT